MGVMSIRKSSPRVPAMCVQEPETCPILPVASGWSECERMWVPQVGAFTPLLSVDWIPSSKGTVRDTA